MKRIFVFTCTFILLNSFFASASAATVTDLQQQIDSHTGKIKQLEEEINKYQGELNKTSEQAKTLQTAVQSLDINAKKLGTDLKVTETKISKTNLSIEELSLQIRDTQKKIENGQSGLASTIRSIHESDSQSLLEGVLTYSDLGHFWTELDAIEQFQSGVRTHIAVVKGLQEELLKNKKLTQEKKNELMGLKEQLNDQKTVVEVNKNEKQKLLSETKNVESGYKQLIADRLAKKKAFESELYKFESELKIAIDPKSVPGAKSGILSWPLAEHVVTQYFGNTEFAQAHTQLYNGKGHNGIDLKASVGTPIMAAASGVVLGTGNTDTVCPGASYGKWVMVQHTNGLSTLYAHLSVIKVASGDSVNSGSILGYSGVTGYATGPHLHFTVYASQGVQIMSRKSQACGGTYTMPVADLQAYLNPLMYL